MTPPLVVSFSNGKKKSRCRRKQRTASPIVPQCAVYQKPAKTDPSRHLPPISAGSLSRHRKLQIVLWKGRPPLPAILCLLGLSLAQTAPRDMLWSRSLENSTTDWITTIWAAKAYEQHLEDLGPQEAAQPAARQAELPNAVSRIAGVKFPEEILQGIHSVDWSSLIGLVAAGLEVAVTEGRLFAKEFMQRGRVQHLLQTLHIEMIEDGLESIVESVGLKEKLPVQLRRERRALEISFVPIFYFARERLLERSPKEDEAALKISLGDPKLKAVVRRFENVPPERSMVMAPSTLDAMYEDLSNVVTVFVNSQPVALSLAVRVGLVTRMFVEYCHGVLSAVTRYMSFVNRFFKNKSPLFFFAQRTLPRILKILLLLNRLEEILIHRARSDFAENPSQCATLRKEARTLAAQTTDLISFLESIAHGCLAATSPQFQVDFARALSSYDRGMDVISAFKQLLGTAGDVHHREQREQDHGPASGQPQRQQPQPPIQHENKKMKTEASRAHQVGDPGSDASKQTPSEVVGNRGKQQASYGLDTAYYNDMMGVHLNEMRDAGLGRYINERSQAPRTRRPATLFEQALRTSVNRVQPADRYPPTRAHLQPSEVASDAGTVGAGIPLQTFVASSPQFFSALSPSTAPLGRRTSNFPGITSPPHSTPLDKVAAAPTVGASGIEESADSLPPERGRAGAVKNADAGGRRHENVEDD